MALPNRPAKDAGDCDGCLVLPGGTESAARAAEDGPVDAPGDGDAVLVGAATGANGHASGVGEATFD